MPFLLLYIGEGRKFDQQAVTNALRNWAEPSQPCEGCLATYQFKSGDDFTIIRFKNDEETIVIDGSGEASLSAALHIQSTYPDNIHMIDEGYSFDVILSEFSSLSELKERIKDAGG